MRRSRWILALLLLPAVIVVVATSVYPLLTALFYSLHNYTLRTRNPQFALMWLRDEGARLPRLHVDLSLLTLDNYTRAFADRSFLNSLNVTFWFTVLSVVLSVVLGLLFALLLQREGRLHTLTKILLIFPFAVSPALKGYSWRFMLHETYGLFDRILDVTVIVPLNALIGLLNALPGVALTPLSTSFAWLGDSFWALFMLAMSETWGWAPLIALMFLGALGSISPEVFEAARLDGCTNWTLFWRVTLPLLMPVVLIVTMLKTIFSLKMFDQVVTMTNGGPGESTQTINFYIYQVGFARGLDVGLASAMAYILVVILTVLALLYVRLVLHRQAPA